MLKPITIAVDVMGGDQGPRLAVLAAAKFAVEHTDSRLLLVGDEHEIRRHLPADVAEIVVVAAKTVVTMTDKPSVALRKKHDSSLAEAIACVADGRASACVSGGNTGAMMAFGLAKLGTLSGIDRPAICKAIPTARGRSFMLDLGANLDSSSAQLLQFAHLGAAMACAAGVANPSVGVLNVGVERQKGGSQQQELLTLLADSDLNTCGFIEGDGIYAGLADVIVCDGFTGNAVLKASEGAAGLMRNALTEVLATLDSAAQAPFASWLTQFDPARFNGAALLGLNGIVVKSHGAASEKGFSAAIQVAYEQISFDYLHAVGRALNRKTLNN